MYSWKLWHDSRYRLALYAAIVAAFAVFVVYQELDSFHRSVAWVMQYPNHSHRVTWQSQGKSVSHVFSVETVFELRMGYVAMGMRLCEQISRLIALTGVLALHFRSSVGGLGSMEFLCTRPEPRRNFVLNEFGFNLLALMGIVMIPLMMFAAAMLYISHGRLGWLALSLMPAPFVLAAAIYALIHYLTTLTRNHLQGFALGMAVLLFAWLMPTAMQEWWHVDWPMDLWDWAGSIFVPMDAGPVLELGDLQLSIPVSVLACWGLVIFLFFFLSMRAFERREV